MHGVCCAPQLIIFTFPPATPPLVHLDGNKHWTCQAGHTTFKWPQCLCNGLMNKLSEHLTSQCLLPCLIFEGNARRMPANFSRVLLSAAASQSPINSPEQLSIGQMPISSFSISISCCWMLPHVPANYCKLSSGILRRPRNWVAYSLSRPIASGGKKVPLKWGMTACQCQPPRRPRLLPTSIIYPKAIKHVQSIFAMDVKVRKQNFQIVMWRESWFGPDVRQRFLSGRYVPPFMRGLPLVWQDDTASDQGLRGVESWEVKSKSARSVRSDMFRHVQTPKATGRQHCHTGFWTLGPLSKFRWIMVDVMVDDGGRDLPITAGHQQLSYYLYLTLVHDGSDFPLWANYVSACVRKTVIVFQTCSRFNLSIQCSQQSSRSSGSLGRSTPEDQFVSKCQQHVSRTFVFVVCCCCSACIDIDIHRRFSWVAWGCLLWKSKFKFIWHHLAFPAMMFQLRPAHIHQRLLFCTCPYWQTVWIICCQCRHRHHWHYHSRPSQPSLILHPRPVSRYTIYNILIRKIRW